MGTRILENITTDKESDELDFSAILNKYIKKKSNSRYYNLFKYCPNFYILLTNMLQDPACDWHSKILISSAISYLIIPDDVINDTEEDGFIDDVHILVFVLNEIKNNISEDLVINNWDGDEDIIELTGEIYDKTIILMRDHHQKILQKVGLWKYNSLDLAEYTGSYQNKLGKLAREKRELLGLCSYLAREVYGGRGRVMGRNIKVVRKFIEKHGDATEIERITHLADLGHEYTLQKKEKKKEELNNNNSIDFEKNLDEMRNKILNS